MTNAEDNDNSTNKTNDNSASDGSANNNDTREDVQKVSQSLDNLAKNPGDPSARIIANSRLHDFVREHPEQVYAAENTIDTNKQTKLDPDEAKAIDEKKKHSRQKRKKRGMKVRPLPIVDGRKRLTDKIQSIPVDADYKGKLSKYMRLLVLFSYERLEKFPRTARQQSGLACRIEGWIADLDLQCKEVIGYSTFRDKERILRDMSAKLKATCDMVRAACWYKKIAVRTANAWIYRLCELDDYCLCGALYFQNLREAKYKNKAKEAKKAADPKAPNSNSSDKNKDKEGGNATSTKS